MITAGPFCGPIPNQEIKWIIQIKMFFTQAVPCHNAGQARRLDVARTAGFTFPAIWGHCIDLRSPKHT